MQNPVNIEPLPVYRPDPAEFERYTSGNRIALSPYGVLEIGGADHARFFHNFCTADIRSLEAGSGTEAFVLNAKGRIIAFGFALCSDGFIRFVTSRKTVPTLAQHLEKYVIREDVTLADRSLELDVWAFVPRQDSAISGALIDFGAASLPGQIYLQHVFFDPRTDSEPAGSDPNLAGPPGGHLTHAAVTASEDRLLILPTKLRDDLEAVLHRHDAGIASGEVFQAARIVNAMPLYGHDIDETNLPQEIRRDRQAVSFTKGCYLGQETVARIDALGHVNRFLVQLKVDGEFTHDKTADKLTDGGSRIGELRSICFSTVDDCAVGLGYVKTAFAPPGTRLKLGNRDCQIIA